MAATAATAAVTDGPSTATIAAVAGPAVTAATVVPATACACARWLAQMKYLRTVRVHGMYHLAFTIGLGRLVTAVDRPISRQ